jgi:hypothetical protein
MAYCFTKSIDRALSRGVKIRWITEKPMDRTSIPKSLQSYFEQSNSKVRSFENFSRLVAKIGIFDSTETILTIITTGGFARSPALWSNNASIAAIAKGYFETCWNSFRELKL